MYEEIIIRRTTIIKLASCWYLIENLAIPSPIVFASINGMLLFNNFFQNILQRTLRKTDDMDGIKNVNILVSYLVVCCDVVTKIRWFTALDTDSKCTLGKSKMITMEASDPITSVLGLAFQPLPIQCPLKFWMI